MSDNTPYDNDAIANEQMAEQQRIYLDTLAAQAGEATPPADLSRKEALDKIEELNSHADGAYSGGSYDIDTEDDPTLERDAP